MQFYFRAHTLLADQGKTKPQGPLPTSHTTRQIEGWTVRVDDRLLSGDGAAVGEQALKLLQARLFLITTVLREEPLAKLRGEY